ncbi:septation protein A [Variovorax sp. PCZ-1]|uniref:septation protein A n=1 Tax=Variovorax sp. PCZ-1 TaxID=2835533 RepID=UPI001BD12018|nr:septation protein A [Variovorax sp. PCZ-1]MBS7807340.1 septation protein A [Variovorax sp. PCZ-1]
MKQLLDFLPILLFFGAYKMYDIYVATGVIMAATVVQMAILYKMEGRLQMIHKVTLGLVLGFGALTLLLHDERFIKIKPTILYAAMGLALAIGLWAFKKNFLRMMLGNALALPEQVWRNLTVAWVAYTFFMAAVNAFVAYYYTTDQWVNFKLWGYVFPIVFLVAQGFYIAKHLPKDEEKDNA